MLKELALGLATLGLGINTPSRVLDPSLPLDLTLSWVRSFAPVVQDAGSPPVDLPTTWPRTNYTLFSRTRVRGGNTGGQFDFSKIETYDFDPSNGSNTPVVPVPEPFEEGDYFDLYLSLRYISASPQHSYGVYFSYAVIPSGDFGLFDSLVVSFPPLLDGIRSQGVWFGNYTFALGHSYGLNPVTPIYDLPNSNNWVSGGAFSSPLGGYTTIGPSTDPTYILNMPTIGINLSSVVPSNPSTSWGVWFGDTEFSIFWSLPSEDDNEAYWQIGYEQGHNDGYNEGLADGHRTESGYVNPVEWLGDAFGALGEFASLQIFPGVSIGTLIVLPVAGALLVWLVGLLRGS